MNQKVEEVEVERCKCGYIAFNKIECILHEEECDVAKFKTASFVFKSCKKES